MATTDMRNGYAYQFVTPPLKSLECPICLLTVCQPHVISCCGNQFCQACIGRIQQDNKPCPLCNEVNFTTFLHKGVMREVNLLMIYCPNKKDGCDWKGELGQLEEHLNPSVESNTGKECGYVLVACRYKCGEMVLRKFVHEHESKLCSKQDFQNQLTKLSDIVSTKFEAVKKECEQLKKKVEKLTTDNTRLRNENQKHKFEFVQVKLENEAIRRTVETFQSTLTALKLCAMPVLPFYFTISNVTWYSRFGYLWESAPFYSFDEGYKMQAFVDLSGHGSGKGTHLSFFLAVLRGEFDHELRWPFKARVAVEMYNQQSQRWLGIQAIDFSDAPHDCQRRPLEDGISNPIWGSHRFISNQELNESYLGLARDFLRFRITSVEFKSS